MKKPKRKTPKLPKTDSIDKLAKFWDSHDLTDFEGELVEATEPVFGRRSAVKLNLNLTEAKALERVAKAKGISREELIRAWVREKLSRRKPA